MKHCEIEQDKNRVSILNPSPTIVSGRRSSFVGSRAHQKKKMIIQVETCVIENLEYSNIQYEIFVENDQNNWFL